MPESTEPTPVRTGRPGPSAGERAEQLLTVAEAAERLGTGTRFIRRLIQERRIRYVKLGKPVRIPASVIDAYVHDHTVPTLREARAAYRRAV